MNHQLAARALINNGWFIVSLSLVVLFARSVGDAARADGWYAKPQNQAAVSLLVYFAGETIARGWSVVLLQYYAAGIDAWPIEERFPIALCGASISFLGAICCARVFSPARWGHWGWMSTVALAVGFMIATCLY